MSITKGTDVIIKPIVQEDDDNNLDAKSYNELKSEKKQRKAYTLSEEGKKIKQLNAQKARDDKLTRENTHREVKNVVEEQKIVIQDNQKQLEELQKKMNKFVQSSESDEDSYEEEIVRKKKNKVKSYQDNTNNEYIMATLKSIDKRVDKLWTAKKLKSVSSNKMPIILNQQPIQEEKKSSQALLTALAQSYQNRL